MDEQNRNLILATALSFLVILVWFVLFPPPEPTPTDPATEITATEVPGTPAVPGAEGAGPTPTTDPAAQAASEAARIDISTPRVEGAISTLGGRIDELRLTGYRESLDPGAPPVTLFAPEGGEEAFYAHFGWGGTVDGNAGRLPGPRTVWTAEDGASLTPDSPVTLRWANDTGLEFIRTISVDDDYMFTVTDAVTNTGADAAGLYAFGVIERQGIPEDIRNFFILHEGVVRMADGELGEIDYDDVADYPIDPAEGGPSNSISATEAGWVGFTDHYWQAVLVPPAGSPSQLVTKYLPQADLYRAVSRHPAVTLAPGASTTATTRLFAGAKEWEVLREYENAGVVQKFVDSIDWGWFFFLTKPIFAVLHYINIFIGNMGISIIVLTLLIKAILLPLAYKSYVSMAKMKELQPEMEKIKERAGDDRQKLQQEMMAMYKKEKVNPASGCLPILLQIPIFFSLYKVIFVTLELRHAPFFGPFNDLSAPDPTSIFNFFGLLPWAAPDPQSILALVFIGILPLLLGISMWLQQKLNPAPTDPTQQMIFAWMPWVFMFMLGSFASGLVVYWIANNTITFIQQYLIMRSQGMKPDVFGNIRSSAKRKKAQEK